ncbi:hypothetical protein JCM12294_32360 [Desulfocicer niacini]
MPFSLEHILKKESDTAISNAHGGGRPLILVLPVKKIIFQLNFCDEIWRFVVKVYHLTN